jgi:hypothetical protein
MAWGAWGRKPAETAAMSLGLDLNAGRLRAITGPPSGAAPRAVLFEDDRPDLPLILHLEARNPTFGYDGYQLVRQLPHAVCRDFVCEIGRARHWSTSRGRLDAAGVLALLFGQAKQSFSTRSAAVLVVPPYITDQQVAQITDIAVKSGIKLIGSVSAPLALAATCSASFGTALVLDVDDHVLTWSVLTTDLVLNADGQMSNRSVQKANGSIARLLAHHPVGGASVQAWFDRLIDAVSDRCIRQCRRDPRDSGTAEQSLFEQLDALISEPQARSQITLQIRTMQWYQELSVTREDLESFAAPLVQLAIEGMRQAVNDAHAMAPVMARPDLLWITADAARLPGLLAAATQNVPESTTVQVLPPDALATAGYVLGGHFLRGELPRGPVLASVPRFAIGSAPQSRIDALRLRSQQL